MTPFSKQLDEEERDSSPPKGYLDNIYRTSIVREERRASGVRQTPPSDLQELEIDDEEPNMRVYNTTAFTALDRGSHVQEVTAEIMN